MSKSKENIPTQNKLRVGARKVNLVHTGQSDEFFTDSILESDATRTSKIPTPIPQKSTHSRSHRARRLNKTALQRKSRTAAESTGTTEEPRKAVLQPPISIRRSKSPSPLRTDTAATPPQVRSGWELESPSTDLRSPPPREFTDVYRQIADEEDLAATEREFSDSDGSLPSEREDEPAILVNHQLHSWPNPEMLTARSHTSRGSTPVQQTSAPVQDQLYTRSVDTMSEPTGMSFLNELTDQRLAAVLTPHLSESAKDRARLREVWSNQKPIAFAKVRRASPGVISLAQDPDIPTHRVTAFSKASGIKFCGTHNDHSSRPGSRHSDGSIENYRPHDTPWDDHEQPLKPLPMNNRIERNFQFSRHHGFPTQRVALTERNLQHQNHAGQSENRVNAVPEDRNGLPNSLAKKSASDLDRKRIDSGSDYSGRAQKIRETLLGINKPRERDVTRVEESQIDWEAAADSATLSRSNGNADAVNKGEPPKIIHSHVLPEKGRKWDIDLTGQSFHVSDSPPVRNKVPMGEGALGREIESLTKRAVTTNRLGEIRERHSLEGLRSKSRSPVPRSSSISSEKRRVSFTVSPSGNNREFGEAVPDTPVVIYRSDSKDSDEKKSVEPVMDSRSNSDDFLQRFAKAMNNTPKSSPPSASISKHSEQSQTTQLGDKMSQVNDKPTIVHETTSSSKNGIHTITETPKVIGAWTDTILPDTVKTIKQPSTRATYLQTPHVSAGGWIDTPLPSGATKLPEMTPITEEIPEGLTSGIVRSGDDRQAEDKIEVENGDIKSQSEDSLPKVGLAGILDRAKQRLTSQDSTAAPRADDTLNLGNETIESLQDLLTLDVDEFTVLSKVFNEEDDGLGLSGAQEEAAILERIGAKLNRLKNNIHEAKKGISQLEYKVSQPGSNKVLTEQSSTAQVCSTCSAPFYATTPHSHNAVLPVASLRVSLPIPLLFYPETRSSPSTVVAKKKSFAIRLPRPTPLGYITIAIWVWYLVECTLSEIYSHPTHAEHYTWPSPHVSEPEFPFVLPAMLSRWLKLENLQDFIFSLLGWLFTFARACFRVLGMWLGLTDGFADGVSFFAKDTSSISGVFSSVLRSISSTAVSTALGGAVETDLSMMNDEYL